MAGVVLAVGALASSAMLTFGFAAVGTAAVTAQRAAGAADAAALAAADAVAGTVTGVPAAELLRAASGIARHRARTEGRLRAAALSSRLLLPLGVCILPAFLLLGVAPMLLSVLASTSLTL